MMKFVSGVGRRARMSTFLRASTALVLIGACAPAVALAEDDPLETIVVTGTRFDINAAPAKASVDTTEPQTIINRSYIANFVPPQSDYVTILAIVPSMTGGDPNGPGLSDGGEKNTLRGLPDGDFVMQFDGIPFGDTNGPTHHNISYFPDSIVGSIVVDRGPGNAGNLGASTYGGTIKIFSQTLTAVPQADVWLSAGSFDTKLVVVGGQTGNMDVLGTTRAWASFQGLESAGALSDQDLHTWNGTFKVENEFAPGWMVTGLVTYNHINEHLDDNNGLTPAQIETYGKDFSLQKTDPNLPTYYAYNYTTKATDFEYVKLNGQITDDLKFENLAYTYAYWNHTFSPNAQTQTLANIEADTSQDNGSVKLFGTGKTVANQLLAYDKENRYRVSGDIPRLTFDYDLGAVTGEIRAGVWIESQRTNRFKYYFDANLCNADLIDPFVAGGGAAASACGVVKGTGVNGPLGYGKDDEHSSWAQYQPFVEVDIKPLENLTITPGVKYVHWDHSVDAPIAQGSLCGVSLACPGFNALGQDFTASFVTRRTLPFLTINYKIDPSWSVYGEYAQGIYVPDISAFENSPPTVAYPAPEITTNYQLGTVFYADNFTFDADIYYIPITNNYISQPCTYDLNDSCYVNNGAATYKGIEAEGTYAVQKVAGMDLTGLSFFASGSIMSSKATSGQYAGKWEPNAPKWTAAVGLLYKQNGFKFALIDKTTGLSYNDPLNNAFYELPSWSNVSLTAGYAFENYELDLNVDNLFNSRATTVITEANTTTPSTNPATSLDQYQFQAPRSLMVTLKFHFQGSSDAVASAATYTPPAVQAPAPAPKVASSYQVFFDFNKSNLTAQAVSIVDTAAKNAATAKVTQIVVTGHTDTVGSDAYNMRLSRRRAESVAAELEKQGIAASEIEIVAKGKHDLLVPTKDGVREPQNRRVQIVFAGGAGA